MAISSSSPAVASRCVHTRSGIGVVASQNVTDPSLGPTLLNKLADGHSALEALSAIQPGNRHLPYRQLMIVDSQGKTATYTGDKPLGIWGSCEADQAAAAGNLLDNSDVPNAMLACFASTSGLLAERLLRALEAGLEAGGEAGPVHSAGFQVVDGSVSWPIVDLRCDWTEECPIRTLRNTWTVYQPQLNDYITRALNPTEAPSYNVPGDD